MDNIKFNNSIGTQVRINGELFELPYRIQTIIEFPTIFVFLASPDYDLDSDSIISKFKNEGNISLYIIDKTEKKIIWTMKNVDSVHPEIAENKKENEFISAEHFRTYLNTFTGKSIISVYIGEFRKIIDATTGAILSSMEIR